MTNSLLGEPKLEKIINEQLELASNVFVSVSVSMVAGF